MVKAVEWMKNSSGSYKQTNQQKQKHRQTNLQTKKKTFY
jgi:hypothetical protein